MDLTLLLLTLAIFSLCLTIISSEKCNIKHVCGELTGNNCYNETFINPDLILKEYKPCQNKNEICKRVFDPKQPSVKTGSCQPYSYPFDQVYPGQKCGDGIGCLSGLNCTVDGICPGSAEGQACKGHSDCMIGLYCHNFTFISNGICKQQVKIGGKCITEEDCVNNAGCGIGNVCVEYLSVEGPETVLMTRGPTSCASGAYENSIDWFGVCINKLNVGETPFRCDDNTPCTYYDTFSKKITTEGYLCGCSSGPNFAKYCPMGNGEAQFRKYISSFKTYLRRTLDFNCHTLERTSCLEVIKREPESYRRFILDMFNARFAHEIQDSPDCVKEVLIQFAHPELPPLSQPTANDEVLDNHRIPF